MELPFPFNHPDNMPFMVGTGWDRYAVASAKSGAFMTFARTGMPAVQGQGEWKPYDPVTRATMVFGEKTRVVNDP